MDEQLKRKILLFNIGGIVNALVGTLILMLIALVVAAHAGVLAVRLAASLYRA